MPDKVFRDKPFVNKPYRLSTYVSKPYSNKPYLDKAYKDKVYQNKPYKTNPYIKDRTQTTYEYVSYLRDLRKQLPNRTASQRLANARLYQQYKTDYENYIKEKVQEEALSTLADHKKGTEINSLRDILLGSHNSHMEHAIDEIPEWLGFLNIIPDSLAYLYKFYLRPVLKGKPLHAAINLLGGFSEDIDAITFTTPVKAVAQGLLEGGDVGKNLLEATFGSEEGIKNFDWDTGSGVGDFFLEMFSDPTFYIPIIGQIKGAIGGVVKGAAKSVLKETLEQTVQQVSKEAAETAAEAATKTISKELAEGLTEALGKEITETGVEKSVLKGFDELWDTVRSGWDKPDTYKNIVNKTITKELKTMSDKLAEAKNLLKINQWDTFQDLDKAYASGVTKNLKKLYGLDDTDAEKVFDYIRKSSISKTATDLAHEGYEKMANKVITSLHNKLAYVDDILSKTVIKAHLTPIGVYPLYRQFKKHKLYDIALKQTISNVNQGLINKFKETAKSPGSFLHRADLEDVETKITKSLIKENSLGQAFAQGVEQRAVITFTSALAEFLQLTRKNILNNNMLTAAQKKAALIENLSAINKHIKSERDLYQYLDRANKKLLKKGLIRPNQEGLNQVIAEFKRIFKYVNTQIDAEEAIEKLQVNKTVYEDAQHVLTAVSQLQQEKYTVPKMLKAVEETRTYNAIKHTLDTVENLDESVNLEKAYAEIMAYLDNFPEHPIFQDLKRILNKILQESNVVKRLNWATAFRNSLVDIVKTINFDERLLSDVDVFTKQLMNASDEKAYLIAKTKLQYTIKDLPDIIAGAEAYGFNNVAQYAKDVLKNLTSFVEKVSMYPTKNSFEFKEGFKPIQDAYELFTQKVDLSKAKQINILPEQLERLSTDKDFTYAVTNIMNSANPNEHELYRNAKELAEEYNHYKADITDFKRASDSLDVQVPLKDDSNRALRILKLYGEANKEAIQTNLKTYNDIDTVRKSVVDMQKMFEDIDKNVKGVKHLFERQRQWLINRGIDPKDTLDVQASSHTMSLLHAVYADVIKIKYHLRRFETKALDETAYGSWYVRLQDLVSDLNTEFFKYNNALERNLKPGDVIKQNTLELLKTFEEVVPWLRDWVIPSDPLKAGDLGVIPTTVDDLLSLIFHRIRKARADKNPKLVLEYIKQYKAVNSVKDAYLNKTFYNNGVQHFVERLANAVDFNYVHQQRFINGMDSVFSVGKYSKEYRFEKLNNIPSIRAAYADEEMLRMLSTVEDPTIFNKLRPSEQAILVTLARSREGKENIEIFKKAIDYVASTIVSKEQRKRFTEAVITTVQNIASQDIMNLNDAPRLTTQIMDSIQGYINSFKLGRMPKNMDYLRKVYELKTDTVDKIADELQKAGIALDTTVKEHSALYDVASQIMVWEHEHPNKLFKGVMLDIETAGSLDKFGNPTGPITEIAIMTRDANKNLKVLGHFKVQNTPQKARTLYAVSSDVAYRMGLTPEEHIAKYISSKAQVVTEAEILQSFYELMQQLPKRMRVHTYNGSRFDGPYLYKRAVKLGIGRKYIPRDPRYLTEAEYVEQLRLLDIPDFQETLERFKWIDDLADKNKDLFSASPETYIRLEQAIAEHIQRQLNLRRYNAIRNAEGKLINPQTVQFFTGIDGAFIKEVLDVLSEDQINIPNMQELLNVVQGLDVSEFTDELEFAMNLKDTAQFEKVLAQADPTILVERLKNFNILENIELDPVIRKHLNAIKDDLIAELSDIKIFHKHAENYIILEELYNPRHERFNAALTKEIFDEWLKIEEEFGVDVKSLKRLKLAEKYHTNLTGALNYGGQTTVAYKSFDPALLKLIDARPLEDTIEARIKIDNHLRALSKEIQSLSNHAIMQRYHSRILKLLEYMKKHAFTTELQVIKLDSVSVKEAWAHAQVNWSIIKRRASTRVHARKLEKELRELDPKLIEILDNKTAYFDIDYKTAEVSIIPKAYAISDRSKDYYNALTMSSELEQLDTALKEFETYGVQINIINKSRRLNNLRKASYTKQGYVTQITNQYAHLGREFTETLYHYAVYNKLTSTPEELISAILYDTPDRTLRIAQPLVDPVFNTPALFKNLIKRSADYKAFGLKFEYDELDKVLKITLDESLDIRKSENTTDLFKWVVNGEEIDPVLYDLPSKEMFEKGYKTLMHQDYRDALYDLYEEIVRIDPRYAGRTGAIMTYQNNQTVVTDLKEQVLIDMSKRSENYKPYFDEAWVGAYKDLQGRIGPRYADAFYSLDSMALRTSKRAIYTKHYADFIINTGFNLQDDLIRNIPLPDLSTYLNKHKELIVAYFKTDKHAIGGIVLDAVAHITPENLALVKNTGNAFIVPWDVYTSAARNFNKFAYDNIFVEAWHKLLQLYKKFWLMSPGTIIRNAIDSTMKNFFEGENPNETIKSYAEAQKLLIQFDQISKDIRKLDVVQDFKFDNITTYFALNKNPIMDKDTYLFLYQLMNDMGINTLYTMADGIFGAFMKPMAMIERISRLSLYLNLEAKGTKYTEILRRISETHFTYDISDSLGYVQALIPFHTYTFSNLDYIMHLIEENPSVLKNFLNVYSALWSTEEMDYEELSENVSLQYQIMNGNIPLKLFGFNDKEIERIVNTEYGEQLLKAKNTAVIKMGSSILDGLNSFINPYQSLMDKIAPPAKVLIDTATEYLGTALGNFSNDTWYSYQDAEDRYERTLGSVSLQKLIESPSAVIDVLPGTDVIKQRLFHKEGDQYKFGSTTGQRTQNPVLNVLGMAGIVGATSRWGEFPKRTKENYRRIRTKSSGYKYYRSARTYNSRYRFNRNDLYLYNVLHPNAQHRAFSKLRSIPQYLYSNMGVNSRGKSKVASWMSMNTRYKVKNTLRRMIYM